MGTALFKSDTGVATPAVVMHTVEDVCRNWISATAVCTCAGEPSITGFDSRQ